MTTGGLTNRLQEHWPPQRMVVTCEECGAELWDSEKENLRGVVQNSAPYVASWVNMEMRRHYDETDHEDITIDLGRRQSKRTTEMVDVEVNVHG